MKHKALRRAEAAMDVLLACAIGVGIAAALVQWWTT